MTIKQNGGVFGRNPTFNDVTIEGQLTFDGDIDINSDLKVDGDLVVTGKIGVGTDTPSDEMEIRSTSPKINFTDSNDDTSGSVGYNVRALFLAADGTHRFFIGGDEKVRILETSGDVSLLGGGNLVVNSGSGIDFSATAGTGTSELLDDYEEGTWTPTILFDGANVGMTFNIQAGNYTKVGNLVTASCYLNLANKGSSTGSAFVGGLPFTSGNVANQNSPSTLWVSAVSFADFLQGFNGVNTSTISLREATNAGVQSSLSEANFANNSSVMVSASYRV